MDRLSGSRIIGGNSIELLPSGLQSYERRWELLQKAQHSIHIVAFSMMKDKTSARLRDIVCEKATAGVQCRLIFDDGVQHSTFAGAWLKEMAAAGAEVIRYHRVFETFGRILAKAIHSPNLLACSRVRFGVTFTRSTWSLTVERPSWEVSTGATSTPLAEALRTPRPGAIRMCI